jgi:glycine cleavage system H protein
MSVPVPADLRYTKDHEWTRADAGAEVVVGITSFAVEQLGDITLLTFDVKVGDQVAPVTGKVVRLNDGLVTKPELVNEDCYGKGWMIAIAPSAPHALDALMDAKAYSEYVKTAQH